MARMGRFARLAAGVVMAGAAVASAQVVSHVQVLSDKVPDVSSLEAWKRSFIKEGMSDKEKALAVWQTAVAFRHQDAPPFEYTQGESHPHDPIKSFNVYGYGQCCCASGNIQALARHAGLQTRGWAITAHSVPEVFYDGAWHMLDASLVTTFPKSDGSLASVEELTAGVSQWLEQNPQYKDDKKLREFMRGGWRKGPEILSRCTAYDDNGWLPAATHGWYSTVQEYASPKKNFPYEYGTAAGYQVNIQLRPGERLVRNWSNKGLHVNQLDGKAPGALKGIVGKDDLRYAPKFGDIAPGRVGNGTHEYDVPLASGKFRTTALAATNLATRSEAGAGPAVQVKDAAGDGVLILRMPSSYVYLSGRADIDAVIPAGGQIAIAFSENNGLDWKDVKTITASGAQTIDLKDLVFRRYDYRLRFTLKGAGTGMNALKLTHDIQHSQRTLPALAEGSNTITFAAGPNEGTITVEGAVNPKMKGKAPLLGDFHPTATGFRDGSLFVGNTGKAEITFPIQAPGDIQRIRVGAHYRARDKRDGLDVTASFDNGTTFKPVGRLEGPFAGNSRTFTFADVPPGAKAALVRLSAVQSNTSGLLDLRIDADYTEPAAAALPVKVTYVWDEAGAEKRDVRTAKGPETWTITCAQKPVMKGIVMEVSE